jgi:calcineurin-like phosphoesterase family protein
MARVRTPNFHNARLSVAQAAIRENVAKRAPGTPASGLFAGHPMLQAASAVLERVDRGEIRSGPAVLAAYGERRAAQQRQGVAVAADLSTPEICLDLLTRYVLAWAVNDTSAMNEIESEWVDTPCDALGWLQAVRAWLEYYWDGAAPQYNPPSNPQGQDQAPYTSPGTFALPPAANGTTLRVGVLGDWGTGEPEAVAVLDQLMQQAPDLIIHVGDVYYAGTQDEQTNNFLNLITAARAQYSRNIPVYTLPGNHDYYSGGAAFYAMIQQLNAGVPNASVQAHSFWALVNDAWQLEGMDTGYHDSDLLHVAEDNTHLRTDEAAWHLQQLGNAGGRTVILFSHHQLYSAFEEINKKWKNFRLLENLQEWRGATSNIAAWLWGHEHVLEVYQVPGTLPLLGRCVGNSAFPVFTDASDYTPGASPAEIPLLQAASSPGGGIAFPHNFVQSQADDLVWASGYALLELPASGAATASYYQVQFNGDVSAATSQLLWQESISASPGVAGATAAGY